MPRLVIDIDGIRTVAPPEQQDLDDSVGALHIDSTGDLPFALDEHDPIFQNKNENEKQSIEPPETKAKKTSTSKPPTSSAYDSSDDEQVVTSKKPVQPAPTIAVSKKPVQPAPSIVVSKKPDQPAPTISTVSIISTIAEQEKDDDSSPGTPTLQQEEDDLMDRLDAEITQAEQDDLMERLDREIGKQEEDDLMERLLHNINQAARSEWARKNSLVEGVETAEEAKNNTDVDLYNWSVQTAPRAPSRTRVDQQSTAIVQDVEGEFLTRGTKIIPKYLSTDRSKPFVTREEFEIEVLKKYNLDWRNRYQSGYTEIQLLDVPDDPDSFQLVVTAHQQNLNTVQIVTANWLHLKLDAHKTRSILEDGASVEIDIKLDRAEGIGARLSPSMKTDDTRGGIWTKLIIPGGQLCKVLGPNATTSGTMIMGVNGDTCRSCPELKDMLANAKAQEGTIVLTLLLSKFADLRKLDKSKLADPSKSPRRRDGKPYSYTPLPRRLETIDEPAEPAARVYSGKPPTNSPRLPTVADSEIARRQAFADVISDPRSVEITIIASSERPLGSTFTRLQSNDNRPKGMWLKTFKEGGQLREILGDPACTVGAAVVKVNGIVCTSADDINTIRKSAAESQTGQSYRLTLCFYDGTDFSGVDKSRLVEGRVNPRRQNGEPYPPSSEYYVNLEQQEQANSVASINDGVAGDTKQVTNFTAKKRAAPESAKEQPSKISRLEKSNQQSSTESNEAKAAREVKAQANYGSYRYFTRKYFDANEIEFQRTGIMKTKVNSCMWERHKELYGHGAICDDHCQCLLKLKELTSTVLSKHAKQEQEKDKKWRANANSAPAGFVNHFMPRFLPRLIMKYPKDSHIELLQRLVDMWAIHGRQRMFGLTCREDCACEEGWEILFGEGDVAKGRVMSKGGSGPTVKKRKLAPNSAVTTSVSNASAAPEPPRKKPATEKRTTVRIPYEVKFNSMMALGAYFVTENGPEGRHCKVHSICNKGQAQSDPRIRPATTVKSVAIKSSAGIEITTYLDLKQYYDQARREASDIRIMFINTDVASPRSSAEGEKDWNKSGHWQGKVIDGWAGGSYLRPFTVAKAKSKETAKARTTPTAANRTNLLHQGQDTRGSIEATFGRSSETPNNRQLVGETEKDWQLVADTDPINTHRHISVPKTILKAKGRGKTQNRSIRFAGKFEERHYLTESMACERYVHMPQNPEQGPVENKASFRSEVPGEAPEKASQAALAELIDAVHKGSCQDLINVLEAGAATHENVSVEGLPTKYKDVKQELAILTRKIESDRSNAVLRQKCKEFQNKKAVLGIYINLSYAIPKVVFLKKWKHIEFRLRRISLRKPPSEVVFGRSPVLSGLIKTFVETASEDLGVLPVRPISEHIMYGDESTSYKVHNNVQVVHENKILVIELFEGEKTDPVLPAKLGSFRIEMNRIDNDCPLRGWGAVTETTTQTDNSLEWAEIEIEMRIIDVQPSYYIWKAKQAAELITPQVERIERFNDDQNQSTNPINLTANIRGINRISLLHAAVHLNDLDLVKRVLRLGANPFLRSTMGSALAYAQQLRDRANEKAMKTSSKDDPDPGRREGNLSARQEVLAHHNKVVELLRSAAHANEFQSSPTGLESAVTASTTTCEHKSDGNGEDLHGDIAEDDDLFGDIEGEACALAGSSSNDSGMGAASKSSLQIGEQQVADAKILREIMRCAPPKAGGVPNGSRCHKGHIGSQLKILYYKQFPDLVSSRAFLQRVIDSGIVKEVKSGNVSTYYFDSPGPTPQHDQPPLQRDVSGKGDTSAEKDGNQTPATSGLSNPGVGYDDLYGDVVVEGNAMARSSSSDSPTPTTWMSTGTLTGLGEQQLYDAGMLRKIMADVGATDGCLNKSYIGILLKKQYPDHFRDRESLRRFLQRVVSSGIVIEEVVGSAQTWRLHGDFAGEGTATGRSSSIDSGTTAASKPNPETLAQRSERQTDEAKILCMIMKEASNTAGGEDGSQCKRSFVGAQLSSRFASLFPGRDSRRNFMRRAIASGIVKEKGTGGNIIWHLANSDTTGNHSRRPSLTSKSYPQQDVRLPELTDTDFKSLYASKPRCRKGDRPGQCWHAAADGGCHFWHISQLLGPALIDDESRFVGARLPMLDPHALTVMPSRINGLDFVTATYCDNKKKMIYFAEGGPLSLLNRKQMIFWYPTREAAAGALQRVVFLVNSTIV